MFDREGPLSGTDLVGLLDDPDSVERLRRYFNTSRRRKDVDSPAWTGARFELLAGGGDRAETADVITADDLVAVTMLSVQVPGSVALALLEGDLGAALTPLLTRVETSKTISDPDARTLLAAGGDLHDAWTRLKTPKGMGWVTAGKILARKRPALVPVYDNVVRCALGHPRGFWLWTAELFADPALDVTGRLVRLREAAGAPGRVSPLRVLDVALWTLHEKAHMRQGCSGLAPAV